MAQTTARLRITRLALCAALFLLAPALTAEGDQSLPYLTDGAGRVVRAEIVSQGERIFVRDTEAGEEFPADWFSLPYPQSYRDRARRTGPLLAAIESVYLFHSGER